MRQEASLLLVLLDFVVHIFKDYASLPKHLLRFSPVVVFSFTNHTHYAAVYDEHGTGPAWCHTAVQGRLLEGNAQPGSLAYGVLFGMNRAHAMLRGTIIFMQHFFHQMPHLIAMRQPARRSDITGYENLLVSRNNAATAAAIAGCPCGHGMCDFHEVLIP